MVNLTPPPDLRNRGDGEEEEPKQTEVYFVENFVLCLKHKVRNLKKKKLKLEYKLRLQRGLKLNKDQLASVEKYEEVLHHLALAQDLHQSLDSLTHSLLRAQAQWAESERRRLCSVLQVQQVLHSLDRDQVQSDLLSGHNQAPKVPAQTLRSLKKLKPLLGLTRDRALSVSEQMDRAAGLFLDLLDGTDSPVADSSLALLKEELSVLVLSPYFSSLPPEESSCDSDRDASKSEPPTSAESQSAEPPLRPDPVQAWDLEPPEHWDQSETREKPWRGAAALVLKKQPGERSKTKDKKSRTEEPFKPMLMEMLALPTDPELRRRRLEELLTNEEGAFSFVQDSVFDADCCPSAAPYRPRRPASDLLSPGRSLSQTLHSTPLPRQRHANEDHAPQVFKAKPTLPPTDLSEAQLRPGFSSASTQTPPEFDTGDDDCHEVDWSTLSLPSTVDLDSGLDSPLASSDSMDAALLRRTPPPPVLVPRRVAFSASRTANFSPRNLDQPVVFDHLRCNAGAAYDPRIGRFTCPATGTYAFFFYILKLASNVPLYVNLMCNDEVLVSAYASARAPDQEPASNHARLPLRRGDQVWVRLHRGAIYGRTWKYSTFSGCLLFQD